MHLAGDQKPLKDSVNLTKTKKENKRKLRNKLTETLTQAMAKDKYSDRFKKVLRSPNFCQERDIRLFVKKHFQDTKTRAVASSPCICMPYVYCAEHVCTRADPK